MERLCTYPIPAGVPVIQDFRVRVRLRGQEWREIGTYLARIDMHNVREASMAYFGFAGSVECEVTSLRESVDSVEIRPQSLQVGFEQDGNTIRFVLQQPARLSVEINGDRFHNLHLFAERTVGEDADGGSVIQPGGGESGSSGENGNSGIGEVDLAKIAEETEMTDGRRLLRLAPGLYRLKGDQCELPSDTTVVIPGGTVVMGSFLIRHKKNVTVTGNGMIYLGHVKKETYLRGADISFSENVIVEGVTVMNPAHYGIHLGNSVNVRISGVKVFSCVGWSDGIDMMACENIRIEDVFLRTSDDCIAVYGGRKEFAGDTRNVSVKRAVLWADVAHPTMIGVHGDARSGGSVIENISFEDMDILEHHEPQDDYLGCLTINAGDDNTVRNVSYKDIRIEQFERGKVLDLQVKWNRKYNDVPGRTIENVTFENIDYSGSGEHTSVIRGFAEERKVKGIRIKNMTVRGKKVLKQEDGNISVGDYTEDVRFIQ